MNFYVTIIFVSTVCLNTNAQVLFPKTKEFLQKFLTWITKSPIIVESTEAFGDTLANLVKGVFNSTNSTHRVDFGLQPPFVNPYNTIDFINRLLPTTIEESILESEYGYMDIRQLIRTYGFPLEEYYIITEDGYNLTLFRIPGNGTFVNGIPVLCMHGLFESSDDFLTAGPDTGIGFLLAADGYDVWLGNARGNKHSRRHIRLKPYQAEFWDFSFHEIGIYDLPAIIDFILNRTAVSSIKYIGHSQGNTVFYVLTSLKQEYNSKISLLVGLSPVAYLTYLKAPAAVPLFAESNLIYAIGKVLGLYEIVSDGNLTTLFKDLIGSLGVIGDIILTQIEYVFTGFGNAQENYTSVPVIEGHFPSGTSVKVFAHFGQIYLTGEFKQFDYGAENNERIYGSRIPPAYPVEKITTPVSLFSSENDLLQQPGDVNHIRSRLMNVVFEHRYKHFNHLDFIWGIGIKDLLYSPFIKPLIKKY